MAKAKLSKILDKIEELKSPKPKPKTKVAKSKPPKNIYDHIAKM